MAKCNKIQRIVRIKQMLRSWRKKAAHSPDVPSGHAAICVRRSSRRLIVPAPYLNHPISRQLLTQAEEEYGFDSRPDR